MSARQAAKSGDGLRADREKTRVELEQGWAELLEGDTALEGDTYGEAVRLSRLGEEAYGAKDLEAARDFFTRALALYEATPGGFGVSESLKSLGDVALEEEDDYKANDYYCRALYSGLAAQHIMPLSVRSSPRAGRRLMGCRCRCCRCGHEWLRVKVGIHVRCPMCKIWRWRDPNPDAAVREGAEGEQSPGTESRPQRPAAGSGRSGDGPRMTNRPPLTGRADPGPPPLC